MSAEILTLPNTPISPTAALTKILQKAENIERLVIMWEDKDEKLHSIRSNMMNKDLLWILKSEITELME